MLQSWLTQTSVKNTCSKWMTQSWDKGPCCPRNNLMGGTILLPLGAEHYMVWRLIIISQNSKFLAMRWSIEHFQTYLLGPHFKVCTNNPLTYFLTSPSMDAMKQRWINKLAKYDFSLKYQKGKNNTVVDALSRISEEQLSYEEAEKVHEAVPVIPGDNTVFKVLKEKEEDQ